MSLKIFIIAGEVSGDRLGSKLIRALREQYKGKIELSGVGGQLMEQEGLRSIFPMSEISVMGYFEVIKHLFKILGLIKFTANLANSFKPDLVITIDSPGFCFRVIKQIIKASNTKFIHYVSPSIWAYRPKRIYQMTPYYDLVLAILPFEPQCYKHTGLKCIYIGHPLADENWSSKIDNAEIRKKFTLSKTGELLGVFVGSRVAEVEKLLPIFTDALNNLIVTKPNITIIFPTVSKELENIITAYRNKINFKYSIIQTGNLLEQERISLLRSFDAALVKSGTSSLELVFAKVPMIVAYKISMISFFIVKYLFRITKNLKFISLANILMKKAMIPEYLQEDCTSSKLSEGLKKLFDKNFTTKQLTQYDAVLDQLKTMKHSPSTNAAIAILNLVK